jgi:2-polyprenyl-6-methoxyphenol hydroxylase-like FAD-dependent oxidoreductase
LQVLYDHIKDKSKIMTNRRVSGIESDEHGVVVTTTDGSTYEGDMVVGADGIHSAVRHEMWRIADEASPGYIPSGERTG